MMISMILLHAYYKFLDKIHDLIQAMRKEQEAINETNTVSKMQKLVHTITRRGRKEKDAKDKDAKEKDVKETDTQDTNAKWDANGTDAQEKDATEKDAKEKDVKETDTQDT